MQSLKGVVRIDGNFTLQAINFEGNDTWLPGLHVGQIILCPDDVQQLSSDEDTAQKPVQRGDHATAAATSQHIWSTKLIKCLTCQRCGNSSCPESLRKNP